MKTRLASLIAVLAFAVSATSCSSGGGGGSASSSAPPSSPAAATTNRIEIRNFTFSPVDAVVAAGSMVTVVNDDSAAHTVTDTGVFDSGVVAPNGGHATFTAPGKPGSYAYICSIHPFIHGTLTVR